MLLRSLRARRLHVLTCGSLALLSALGAGAVQGASGPPEPRVPAAASTSLDEYVRLQVGSFTTAEQAARDARYDTAIWHLAEIWPGRERDARWIYSESWMKDAAAPYMQRISRLSMEPDGSIVARRFTIPNPERLVGAWKDPGKLATLDAAALRPLEGCDAVIARTGPRRFEGGTLGNRCRNAYKGSSYAVSRQIADERGFTNWDRGFAADGTLTWGPAAGGYEFRRIAPDTAATAARPRS